MTGQSPEQYGLAEPQMLKKIDKLFACGVGSFIALPQIVVVGDQSSGKSSVLEGLINKPLPRDSGLCTRFATQIVFRREPTEKIVVSIIPAHDASLEHQQRVAAWGRSVSSLDSDTFKEIMREAHQEMGLSEGGDTAECKPTFSNDVLRLEISGPDQEHLSVIDVPGIFKSTTEGLTTKADIRLVRQMVKGYMENPRSVMLAVIPANVDVATQEILELAAEADPDGDRTLGVLTKPDLVDRGAEPKVVEMVEGRARPMKLGWHIIRNPGQQELKDATLHRGDLEMDFFRSQTPWDGIEKDKVGVDSLRIRLKEVLSTLVKRVFPRVKAEIKLRLETCRKRLGDLGEERNSSTEQAVYLTKLASSFQRLVSLALNATHAADDKFESTPGLRIAPAVMARLKSYSDDMALYGHAYSFVSRESTGSKDFLEFADDDAPVPEPEKFNVRKYEDLADIVDILHPATDLHTPQQHNIKAWLAEVFQGNRGFEMGTFNPSILPTAMKKQSSKWSDISLGCVSDVVVLMHAFTTSALSSICSDRNVRDALIGKLSDELIKRYERAISNASFLLTVEKCGMPLTLNHYFNDNLQKSRQVYATAEVKKNAFHNGSHGMVVRLEHATATRYMSNEEHITQDIHDILQSYYKVSRKTLVDNVCKQAVQHYLLQCEDSPLALFSPVFVSELSTEALEEIAGEAPALKRTRAQLKSEIASLEDAVKILGRA